ncbi:sulfurtransferase TusA family protein [Psychrobacter lutiphocae]|uniref:sulfurtransferase TusA family protein n=1 Tax=Psychrobacter lutiphocae TaxID=540500 RepID=UPI00037090F8|nr:sulfurtransferase TusA family protein [Psychrobacter lutiphocae]
MIHINLPDIEQKRLATHSLQQLTATKQSQLETLTEDINLTALVDGRGLACPMPLLKAKVTLRTMNEGDSLYILATDPNSQIDLAAFCQQAGLTLVINTDTPSNATNSLEKLDTIFHLIITKTNGN